MTLLLHCSTFKPWLIDLSAEYFYPVLLLAMDPQSFPVSFGVLPSTRRCFGPIKTFCHLAPPDWRTSDGTSCPDCSTWGPRPWCFPTVCGGTCGMLKRCVIGNVNLEWHRSRLQINTVLLRGSSAEPPGNTDSISHAGGFWERCGSANRTFMVIYFAGLFTEGPCL